MFRTVAQAYGTDHYEFDLSPDLDYQTAIEDFKGVFAFSDAFNGLKLS